MAGISQDREIVRSGGRFDPSQYERVTFRNKGGAAVSQIEVSSVTNLIASTESHAVLDVGMGTGRILRKVLDRATIVVGVDPDLGMIRHAANGVKRAGLNTQKIDLVVATGENLPFREDSFTSVICVRALRYFTNPSQGVMEMCSVLSHNGRLVLEFSNIFQPRALVQIPKLVLNRNVFPRFFRLAYVRRQLFANGVSIDTVTSWHKFPTLILTRLSNAFIIASIAKIELFLQKSTPLDFLSRSILVSGLKQAQSKRH